MAMMWAVPMASAGVRTTAVLERLAKRGEGGGLSGGFGFRLGRVWGFSSGLSEGMCNFRVGNLAFEPSDWRFSLIGASGLKPVPRFKNRAPS